MRNAAAADLCHGKDWPWKFKAGVWLTSHVAPILQRKKPRDDA